MKYKDATNYLETFIKPSSFVGISAKEAMVKDPLDRMRRLLELLGNPQNKFNSVLIGGTSGKGSTAYLISHVLTKAGYKTGLTISPHLQKVNERIQINEVQINDANFTNIVSSIVRTIELMKKEGEEPSYFEILIAMAFLYFAGEKVDIAVVEVGMGGKFDATNTLNPLISVLTNVSLDHTNILGKTVLQIAKEKVGIIKKLKIENGEFKPFTSDGGRLKRSGSHDSSEVEQIDHKSYILNHKSSLIITGVKQPSVIKLVEDKCEEAGVELYRLDKDFDFKIEKEDFTGTVFNFKGLTNANDRGQQLNHVLLSLIGKHQVENASIALETIFRLEKFGFKVDEEAIRKSLTTSFFPGRFEIINLPYTRKRNNIEKSNSVNQRLDQHSSAVVLDGAHNPTKMKAFLKALKKFRGSTPGVGARKLIFIVGFKYDKDVNSMLNQILKLADVLIITEFSTVTDVIKNGSQQISRLRHLLRQGYEGQEGFGGQANLKSQISNLISTVKTKNIKVYFEKDSKKAFEKAISLTKSKEDLIVVTGSLYLVGEVRNFLTFR